MARFSQKDILHALEVLGFTSKASIEEIVLRTQELRSEYQDAEDPEDRKRWIEIEQSSRILTEHFEYVTRMLSSRDENGNPMDPSDVAASVNVYIDIWKETESNKIQNILYGSRSWFDILVHDRKPLLFALIALMIFGFVGILFLPTEFKYGQTESLMQEFSRENMLLLGESIDSLPDNYRRVPEFTTDYLTIMSHVSVLERGQVFTDYERMRESYFALASLDEQSENWDLSRYLQAIDIEILVLGIEWTSPQYRFRFYTATDPDRYRISTNLPSARIQGFGYYFYTERPASNANSLIFWFQNSVFSEDVFKAYRIVSATRTELIVYCYSDGQMYTLYAPQIVDGDPVSG